MKINLFISNSTKTLLEIPNINVTFPETARNSNELFLDFFVNKKFKRLAEEDKDYCYNVITNSNTLVNLVGHLIAEKKLSNKDINLFIVEEFNDEVFYKAIHYNTEGYVTKHYPLGYMQFDFNLLNLYEDHR